jgi:uncharacterized membrane protein (DUF2068 family)
MTDTLSQLRTKPKHHNRWLILIATFKLCQALLFAAVGFGALHLLHRDVGDQLARVADHLPESRFIDFLLDRASLIDDRMLMRIGALGFVCAGVNLIEGVGLYLELVWAEYLTLIVTGSFMPWEIFEIFRRITIVRVGLLTVNVLVFIYLLKLVMERSKRRCCVEEKEPDA